MKTDNILYDIINFTNFYLLLHQLKTHHTVRWNRNFNFNGQYNVNTARDKCIFLSCLPFPETNPQLFALYPSSPSASLVPPKKPSGGLIKMGSAIPNSVNLNKVK